MSIAIGCTTNLRSEGAGRDRAPPSSFEVFLSYKHLAPNGAKSCGGQLNESV